MLARAEAKEQLGEYRWRVFGYPRALIKFLLMVSMASGQKNNGALSLSSLHAGPKSHTHTHGPKAARKQQRPEKQTRQRHRTPEWTICKRIRIFGIKMVKPIYRHFGKKLSEQQRTEERHCNNCVNNTTTNPDWKVCRMRGGTLRHPNFFRGCICVTKQQFYCFLLLCTKISQLEPWLKFKVRSGDIGCARQIFQSGNKLAEMLFLELENAP